MTKTIRLTPDKKEAEYRRKRRQEARENRLKELRISRNKSQKEIAQKMSVTEKTISRWENGESQIKPDKAQALADYFGVSTSVLLGYRDTTDSLGFRLWTLRNEKKLKVDEVAEKLHLSVDELKTIENIDNATLGPSLAQDFAELYDVSVAYLLGYSDDEKTYSDEWVNPDKLESEFDIISLKRFYEEDKKDFEKNFINFLKDNAVFLSDEEIKIILDLISSMRLDNPNTYKGVEFARNMISSDYGTKITDLRKIKRVDTVEMSKYLKFLEENGYSIVLKEHDK